MKKVLITGASGFAGGFLAEHLLTSGNYDIFGTYTSDESLERSPVKEKIQFKKVDLQNRDQITSVLAEIKPEYIYHLAAQANVFASFKDPITTFHANIDSQVNLFEALRQLDLLGIKVLVICSSEEYGYLKPEDIPVKETAPLRPANPYSVSKVAQDYLAFQYNLNYKMPIIRARPFNHIGPRQKTGYVAADFAKQITDIEKGRQEAVIKVGNLDAKRDFTDVRDMVRAYPMLLEKGISGEVYNVGSGTSHKIREILDIMLSHARIAIKEEVDPNKLRPSDVPDIVCDNTKFTQLTGWKPEIPLEQTVKDTLDYWRNLA